MSSIRVERYGSQYIARCTYEQKDIVKAAGFRWDGAMRQWYTTDAAVAAKLDDIEALRQRVAAANTAKVEAIQMSRASESDADIPRPEGLEYLPYQRAGIAYACRMFGFEIKGGANAKGSLSQDSESASRVSGQPSQGPRTGGESQSKRGDAQVGTVRGVETQRIGGDKGGDAKARDTISSPGGDIGSATKIQGWERSTDDRSGANGMGNTAAGRICDGVSDQNARTFDGTQAADSVQGRLRESTNEDRGGIGRSFSSTDGAATTGQEENGSARISGLDSHQTAALKGGASPFHSSKAVLIADEMG